jgi:hypothetical protein
MIIIPSEHPHIEYINVVLHQLVRVNKLDVSRTKEDVQQRLQSTLDLLKLGNDLLVRDENVTQSITHVLAYVYQYLLSPEHEEHLKQRK